MEYFLIFICFLVFLLFLLIDYYTIPFYIKHNKNLFWSLYHYKIIKILAKDYERLDDDE